MSKLLGSVVVFAVLSTGTLFNFGGGGKVEESLKLFTDGKGGGGGKVGFGGGGIGIGETSERLVEILVLVLGKGGIVKVSFVEDGNKEERFDGDELLVLLLTGNKFI
ncbi:hypothetical protein GM3709_2098 [Geminocystis sp. NIES-3709]|nr:hypothetical protein GM3709_2098 [Geminocystis sp. NIES-3709]